jgi:hypothetical protein
MQQPRQRCLLCCNFVHQRCTCQRCAPPHSNSSYAPCCCCYHCMRTDHYCAQVWMSLSTWATNLWRLCVLAATQRRAGPTPCTAFQRHWRRPTHASLPASWQVTASWSTPAAQGADVRTTGRLCVWWRNAACGESLRHTNTQSLRHRA